MLYVAQFYGFSIQCATAKTKKKTNNFVAVVLSSLTKGDKNQPNKSRWQWDCAPFDIKPEKKTRENKINKIKYKKEIYTLNSHMPAPLSSSQHLEKNKNSTKNNIEQKKIYI